MRQKQTLWMATLCGVLTTLSACSATDSPTAPRANPDLPTASAAALSIPGLAAYYPMDGTMAEGSNAALDGTQTTGVTPTTDRFGIPAMALQFDGVDGFVTVPGSTTNNRVAGTINVWLNRVPFATPEKCGRPDLAGPNPFTCQHYIFAKEGGPNMRAQFGGSPVDQFYFQLNGESALWTPGSLTFDGWHMYTFVWSASQKQIYLDGSLVASTANTLVSPADGTLYLGHNSTTSLGYRERYEGAMDDLRIYDRALTASEILSLKSESTDPTSDEDCMNGGWAAYGFKNQGQCIRYLRTGLDSRVS